jgi:hypothetical protein
MLVFFFGGLVVIVLLATYFGFDLEEVVNTRIMEKDSDMASAKARVISYDVFVIVFPENPWLGVGPETKKDVIDLLRGEAPLIHVGYLSYLYFYGIAGCVFFFLALFFLIRDSWIVGRQKNFWGSFYGLIAFPQAVDYKKNVHARFILQFALLLCYHFACHYHCLFVFASVHHLFRFFRILQLE